ncbi:MAG TPA: MoaD/ThiS family protein [Opitutaceae bacterium]|nr:MoaD/ThiS family protein [Opitutaceae bacterium]
MQIEVTIPSLLADSTGDRRHFPLEADTLAGALRRLLEDYPQLRPHLYDETMRLRRHVLIFFNDDNLALIEDRSIRLKTGDRLQVVQAVSGG